MSGNIVINENGAYALITMQHTTDDKGHDRFMWSAGAAVIQKDESEEIPMHIGVSPVVLVSPGDIGSSGTYEVCVYLSRDEIHRIRRVLNSACRRARAVILTDTPG